MKVKNKKPATVTPEPLTPPKAEVVLQMTAEKMREILGWQEETEDGEPFGQDYTLLACNNKKVRLTNNVGNRPFDHSTSKKYRQEMLNKRWMLNGESFVVTAGGHVASGQHRGVALVEAQIECEQHADKWKKVWSDGVVSVPMVMVYGISSSPDVIRTLDVTKARTLSDVLVATDAVGKIATTDMQKREVARMLAAAIDLMWRRTQPGLEQEEMQTHSASLEWLQRHPKMLDCVLHLFQENSDRSISLRKVSAGQCAALMYLFATSNSSRAKYLSTHNEKSLDFGNWEKAKTFFSDFAKVKPNVKSPLSKLVDELAWLVSPESGDTGRQIERRGTIIKAWQEYKETGKCTSACRLETGLVRGMMNVVEWPTCGGIDIGEKPSKDDHDDPVTEALAVAGPKGGLAKLSSKAAAAIRARYDEVKELSPSSVALFRHEDGFFDVWEDDAEVVAAAMDAEAANVSGLRHFRVEPPDLGKTLKRLKRKHEVVQIESGEDGGVHVVPL